ncbi:MAG: NADH-ubiquinone oxidoreductase-F iron-sulfur binding region domain-containing protein [Sulfurimonas sp.]|nr:NADH-ubiquinone oxidoreductase-F iron-sulfur binding region domain-containing protein [Sulfurimonas sp.]
MINSLEELEALANTKRCNEQNCQEELRVCVGSSCASLGSENLKEILDAAIKENDISDACRVKAVGCNGLCAKAPLISHCNRATKISILYEEVEEADLDELIQSVLNAAPVTHKHCDITQDFFAAQTKIVLENAGIIDPDDIEDYIAHDGYKTLFETLENKLPNEVIEEIKKSGLRGRGGGGFYTGLKWESVAKVQSEQKYIICNGDEGDPGAFMDRALMEADPHRILEGMALAGYACGADKGYIYVRAEYPIAVEKLTRAIKQAKKLGILGENIAHSNFSFNVEIRLGAGAFVCGEATALITSIEGNRGNPRQKPPHLSDYGLFGQPTVLNNVETLANIVPILKRGAQWFKSIGTASSSGTKVFALTGHIQNSGLVEVAMGTTLRTLIYKIGGGIPHGKKFKAIQTGGPSGGCIPESLLDLEVDYESLKKVGSIMGSGGMIVMDEDANMVELARFFMDFCKSESCGKCTPCRVGTVQLTELLDKFVHKKATKKDLELLQNLSHVVKDTSLCGLGQSAPNPVLSTLKYFENEYLEGISND